METPNVQIGSIVKVLDHADRVYTGCVVEKYSSSGIAFGVRILEGLEDFAFKHTYEDLGLDNNYKLVYAPECKKIEVLANPEIISSDNVLSEGIIPSNTKYETKWYQVQNPENNEWVTLCECKKKGARYCNWSFNPDKKSGLTESFNRINYKNFFDSQHLNEADYAEDINEDTNRERRHRRIVNTLEEFDFKDSEIKSLMDIASKAVYNNTSKLSNIIGNGSGVESYEDIKQEILVDFIEEFRKNKLTSREYPFLYYKTDENYQPIVNPDTGEYEPVDKSTNRIEVARGLFSRMAGYYISHIITDRLTSRNRANIAMSSQPLSSLIPEDSDISEENFLDHVFAERGENELAPDSTSQKELEKKVKNFIKEYPTYAPERIYAEWMAVESGVDIDVSNSDWYKEFKDRYEPSEETADKAGQDTAYDKNAHSVKGKPSRTIGKTGKKYFVVPSEQIRAYIIKELKNIIGDKNAVCALENNTEWYRFKDQMEWVLREKLGLKEPV